MLTNTWPAIAARTQVVDFARIAGWDGTLE
jgi:hypothetical protein